MKKKKKLKPYKIVSGDVLEWCRTYTGPKFHGILCDPPYELNFMNKGWDNSGIVFNPDTWKALKEHLHPGAFCFAFSSTRTLHRMMVAIEDAGFVIHPFMALWNFSNGFPKASNPSLVIDKMQGANRITVNEYAREGRSGGILGAKKKIIRKETVSSTVLGEQWNGHRYGLQALKPAFEPIICFQKPYPKKIKPVVSMLATGAGALSIDACRIGYEAGGSLASNPSLRKTINGGNGGHVISTEKERRVVVPNIQGRWPSNLMLCHLPECKCIGLSKLNAGMKVNSTRDDEQSKHSKKRNLSFGMRPGLRRGGEETIPTWECVDGCPVKELGMQSGDRKVATSASTSVNSKSILRPNQGAYQKQGKLHQDSGTASRYYFQGSWDLNIQENIYSSVPVKYVTKPAQKEKNAGLNDRNTHPTVKPIRIAEYLAKLLMPPSGYRSRLLVPFAGSGSEMIGARKAGWDRVVGIELLHDHVTLAKQRLRYWEEHNLDVKKADGSKKSVFK